MIDLALKTTLVFALAALVNALLRRASAAQRHSIWMLAFAAVPFVAWFPRIAPAAVPTISVTALGNAVGGGSVRAFPYIKIVWYAVTALLLVRLAFSYLWMHYRRQYVAAPVTFGILRPEILLPATARNWPPETLASVMLHERAHIRRRHTVAQLFTQIVSAFIWFQPLVWYAARRAAEERERACDDLVVNEGVPASLYASHLLEIARESSSTPESVAAIPMARACSLESRLRAVLDKSTPRATVTPRYRAALLILAALLIPAISGLKAQDSQIHKMGEPGLTAPQVLFKVEPKYTEEAREAKIQGTVLLSLVVNSDGTPSEVTVVRGLDSGLDVNALAALTQWRFKPGTKDGQPVAVAAQVEVNFQLR